MVRIAPVRLSFNPKTLWFDAGKLELKPGDAVVVTTARGKEFGRVSKPVFEMGYEQTRRLKSPLKPVERLATGEDVARDAEMAELSMAALPIFRQVAAESAPDMNPVAVEYLFNGEKAVFYFDSEERVDFRDLVRKLASELHIRVDMKQIGVRDGARMVGGLGHCGQELCCARLGGEFNPVSIRMAKEQDLSLNPQKISGCCGRLMCCLRYEFEAYKDFHGRAPKKNARIDTPDGEGKVVDLDVPREVVSVKVGDAKPVKVPLAEMDAPEEGERPRSVGEEAWEKATTPATTLLAGSSSLFTSELSGDDKLAEPGKVRHVHGEDASKQSRSRRRRRGSSRSGAPEAKKDAESQQPRKQRRRRSTTVSADGSTKSIEKGKRGDDGREKAAEQKKGNQQGKQPSRRRSRSKSDNARQKQQGQQAQPGKTVQVGRNSSALRAGRDGEQGNRADGGGNGSGRNRRRRRSRKSGVQGGGEKEG